jgi:hypothetical protein
VIGKATAEDRYAISIKMYFRDNSMSYTSFAKFENRFDEKLSSEIKEDDFLGTAHWGKDCAIERFAASQVCRE